MEWTNTGLRHRTNEPLRDYLLNGIFQTLSDREQRFIVAANHTMNHESGACYPGVRLVEAMTGIRRDKLRQAIARLRSRGLVTEEMSVPASGRPKARRPVKHFHFWMPDNDPMCLAFRERLGQIAPALVRHLAKPSSSPRITDDRTIVPAVRKSLAVGKHAGPNDKPPAYWALVRRMQALKAPIDEINAIAQFDTAFRKGQGRPATSIEQIAAFFQRHPWGEK